MRCHEAARVRLRGRPKRVGDLAVLRPSAPLPPAPLMAHVQPRRPRRSPLVAGDMLPRVALLASYTCFVPCNLVYTASQTLQGIRSRSLKVPACIAHRAALNFCPLSSCVVEDLAVADDVSIGATSSVSCHRILLHMTHLAANQVRAGLADISPATGAPLHERQR